MNKRRYLSLLAGRDDPVTRAGFKGVFTQTTLPMASNLLDLNRTNLFFIELDDHFITVFNTPTVCCILDPVSINVLSDNVENFVSRLIPGLPVTRIPFRITSKDNSLQFALLVGVGLMSKHSLSSILRSFDFKPNNLVKNSEIINIWFRSRYTHSL